MSKKNKSSFETAPDFFDPRDITLETEVIGGGYNRPIQCEKAATKTRTSSYHWIDAFLNWIATPVGMIIHGAKTILKILLVDLGLNIAALTLGVWSLWLCLDFYHILIFASPVPRFALWLSLSFTGYLQLLCSFGVSLTVEILQNRGWEDVQKGMKKSGSGSGGKGWGWKLIWLALTVMELVLFTKVAFTAGITPLATIELFVALGGSKVALQLHELAKKGN